MIKNLTKMEKKIALSEIEDGLSADNDALHAMTEAVSATSQPNYWSVIPAFVKYNKSLTWFEKILYSEISSLSNKFGYCFATNKYFIDTFGNSERTIRTSLAKLSTLGFISLQNEISSKGTDRKIFLNGVGAENFPPHQQKTAPLNDKKQSKDGVDKPYIEGEGKGNSKHIIVNTSISKDIVKDPSVKLVTSPVQKYQSLPSWFGNTPLLRLLQLYELMFEYQVGTPCDKIKLSSAGCASIKRVLIKYGEAYTALCIITHFEWRGLNGTDDSIRQRMQNNGFPVTWISTSSAVYYGFIKNVLKIDTEKLAIERINEVLLTITTKHD